MEREKLVRYCARFTGDPHAAEDLAQQVLLDALQHEWELRDPRARQAWLFAIAHNACLMWARRRRREMSRLLGPGDLEEATCGAWPDDDYDLEVELEQSELAQLLDRALALLPPATRTALVQRYVEGWSQAEIADRLGLSEGAVEARLHRGKLALRRVLVTELHEEAASYGLLPEDAKGRRETPIWCPLCGARRLRGSLLPESGDLALSCPGCTPGTQDHIEKWEGARVLRGVRGYEAALSKISEWADGHFGRGISEGVVGCLGCGRPVPLMPAERGSAGGPYFRHEVRAHCTRCGLLSSATLFGLALTAPESRRFRREHRRIRALPVRQLEVLGRAALLTSFESVAGSARLHVLHARDTYSRLAAYPE